MHSTLSQLYADHFNFLRLLQCLEAEIGCYEQRQADQVRLPIVLDIIEYVRVYPERYHHPLENLALEVLLRKKIPQSPLIWRMRSEHNVLEKLSQRAELVFNAVANDTVVSVDDLVASAREFIQRQLEHIGFENRDVYPLLEEHLTMAEWDQISHEYECINDPLFSPEIKQEFVHLYRSIIKAEKAESGSVYARSLGEAKRVLKIVPH